MASTPALATAASTPAPALATAASTPAPALAATTASTSLPRFRVSVVGATGTMPTKCPKCVVDAVVLVTPFHDAIARIAINKLKLKVKDEKRLLLTLKTPVGPHAAGTILPAEGDIREYLANDCIIAVGVRPAEKRPQQAAIAAAAEHPDVSDAEPIFSCLDMLTMPDILALLSVPLSVRSFFRLSLACKGLRNAVNDCDSGPWWQDACSKWSPMLVLLKASAPSTLSWRQLLQQQVAAARQAWRDEDEYSLVLLVNTEPEPGLPEEAMRGIYLLPFRLPGSASETVELKPELSIALADLDSRPRRFLDSHLRSSESMYGGNSVQLLLLRKTDGAILDLCDDAHYRGRNVPFQIQLKSSSGLTGEPGGLKELKLRFDSVDDFQGMPSERSRRSAKEATSARRKRLEGDAIINLRYHLPRRDGSDSFSSSSSSASVGADQYGRPFLASVELVALPITDYWAIEELCTNKALAGPLWKRIQPKELDSKVNMSVLVLREAVAAAGVTVLAEAWRTPKLLAALLVNNL